MILGFAKLLSGAVTEINESAYAHLLALLSIFGFKLFNEGRLMVLIVLVVGVVELEHGSR